MTKVCAVCGCRKNYTEFHNRGSHRPNDKQAYCKSCSSSERAKEREVLKLETFVAYGGPRCACCGQDGHVSFLALDHINNDGNEERKSLPTGCKTGVRFYATLKKRNWPEGYQVLCHTCNVAKYIMGECPHKFLLGCHTTGSMRASEARHEDSTSSVPANF